MEAKMKGKKLLLFGFMIVIGLAACALGDQEPGQRKQAQPGPPPSERPVAVGKKAAPASDFPVIGYLEKRGHSITIKAGPKGPVYSAKTTAGKILFENISTEQLQAQVPELHQFIKTAVACGSGKSGVVIDASMRWR
jgi:hypothetical protein